MSGPLHKKEPHLTCIVMLACAFMAGFTIGLFL